MPAYPGSTLRALPRRSRIVPSTTRSRRPARVSRRRQPERSPPGNEGRRRRGGGGASPPGPPFPLPLSVPIGFSDSVSPSESGPSKGEDERPSDCMTSSSFGPPDIGGWGDGGITARAAKEARRRARLLLEYSKTEIAHSIRRLGGGSAIMGAWRVRPSNLRRTGGTRPHACATTSERRSGSPRARRKRERPTRYAGAWPRISSPLGPARARRWTPWPSSTAGGARTARSSDPAPSLRRPTCLARIREAVEVMRPLLPRLETLNDEELRELDAAARVIDAETRALREAVARETPETHGDARRRTHPGARGR